MRVRAGIFAAVAATVGALSVTSSATATDDDRPAVAVTVDDDRLGPTMMGQTEEGVDSVRCAKCIGTPQGQPGSCKELTKGQKGPIECWWVYEPWLGRTVCWDDEEECCTVSGGEESFTLSGESEGCSEPQFAELPAIAEALAAGDENLTAEWQYDSDGVWSKRDCQDRVVARAYSHAARNRIESEFRNIVL